MDASVASLVMIFALLPFMLLGIYEKNGQPFEKTVQNILQVCFLRPKTRPYMTDNFYSAVERQAELDNEVHQIVKGKKKLTRADKKQIEAAEEKSYAVGYEEFIKNCKARNLSNYTLRYYQTIDYVMKQYCSNPLRITKNSCIFDVPFF